MDLFNFVPKDNQDFLEKNIFKNGQKFDQKTRFLAINFENLISDVSYFICTQNTTKLMKDSLIGQMLVLLHKQAGDKEVQRSLFMK